MFLWGIESKILVNKRHIVCLLSVFDTILLIQYHVKRDIDVWPSIQFETIIIDRFGVMLDLQAIMAEQIEQLSASLILDGI